MSRSRDKSHFAVAMAALVAAFFALATRPAAAQSLVLERSVDLPSVEGRLDHMDIDVEGHRLFVAALGGNSVEVVDLVAGKRITRIQPLHEPQGIAYVASARSLFVANGAGGDVKAFAEGKAPAVATTAGLADADNVRIDPVAGRLYVGYAHALAVLDLGTLRVITRIELAGHPEGFQLETGGRRIFVNVPSARHIAVVDRSNGTVTATWDLAGASGNFPMALDESNHRLFVATRQPAQILVYDTNTGRRAAALATCGDADDLLFDSQRRQLYAVCGEGVVHVIHQRDPDHYEVAQRVPTSTGARTGLFVPQLSTLFVAVPSRGGSAAQIRAYRAQ